MLTKADKAIQMPSRASRQHRPDKLAERVRQPSNTTTPSCRYRFLRWMLEKIKLRVTVLQRRLRLHLRVELLEDIWRSQGPRTSLENVPAFVVALLKSRAPSREEAGGLATLVMGR